MKSRNEIEVKGLLVLQVVITNTFDSVTFIPTLFSTSDCYILKPASYNAQISSTIICNHAAECGPPPPVTNGFINDRYTSTVEGAVITYHCNEGLSPSGQLTAVCQSNGRWRPNPAETTCRMATG